MPNERVVEIPWALSQLPQTGVVLDVGSWSATYLETIPGPDRVLHCLDPQDCRDTIPAAAIFHQQSIIGNTLPRYSFDCVLLLSTIEHIGLQAYGQQGFVTGDRLALAETAGLLAPGGYAVVTVPAGTSKITSWYRQYSPEDLDALFQGWTTDVRYWGYRGGAYVPIEAAEVGTFDYRYGWQEVGGAGAIAGIVARPQAP